MARCSTRKTNNVEEVDITYWHWLHGRNHLRTTLFVVFERAIDSTACLALSIPLEHGNAGCIVFNHCELLFDDARRIRARLIGWHWSSQFGNDIVCWFWLCPIWFVWFTDETIAISSISFAAGSTRTLRNFTTNGSNYNSTSHHVINVTTCGTICGTGSTTASVSTRAPVS